MREKNSIYSDAFFATIHEGAVRSARVVVPILADLTPIRSVVDVGCGSGAWLTVFKERGVARVFGIDGSVASEARAVLAPGEYQQIDLESGFVFEDRFDLCISLEVAEHLNPAAARNFVRTLTSASDVVVFSAAVPGQGGTKHINCRWPSYWQEHFRAFGYVMSDCIRPFVSRNPDIEYWYRQNVFLFVKENHPLERSARFSEFRSTGSGPESPELLLIAPELLFSPRFLLRLLPGAIVRKIRRRFRRPDSGT